MKTVLLVLLVLSVLAGCATQAQQQSKQLKHNYQAAFVSMSSCMNPLMQSPVAHRLRKILILDNDDPRTVEKLAMKRYITEQEAKDIIELSRLRKPCHRLGIEEFSKVHPEFVATLAKIFSEEDADAAKAINHELTIGVANQRIVDRANQVEVEFSKIAQRIISQLKQAHQYEVSQQRIAQQELQRWNYQQQILANQRQALFIKQQKIMNQPIKPIKPFVIQRMRTTDCNYYGNTIHCTHN